MIPSEQANHPQWPGQGFEIWFFVVLVPGVERALWVRMTRFAAGASKDARVWAVASTPAGIVQQRDILPLETLTTEGEDGSFHVRVGEAELGHGHARGRCGRIAWEFRYEATDPVIVRLPKLPSWVPLGTRAAHPHAEASVSGWVELDGRREPLEHGMLTQMHIWGQQRVEWLRWAWAPCFEGHDAEVELTVIAPKADGSNLCSLWARIGEQLFDNSGLTKAMRAQLLPIRPGVLHHVGTSSGRRLVVRFWAEAASFAGWDYRQIGDGDLHVAQSNLAHCELELYRRVGFGWQPELRLRSRCAALEFHGPDDYDEFHYVGWDARETDEQGRLRTRPKPALPTLQQLDPPGPGAWIETPAPSRIVGLGLTYRAHAEEVAADLDGVLFEIDPAAWTTSATTIARPSSARLLEALRELDPSLSTELAEFGFMPAMLDYEGELGLLLLDGLAGPTAIDELGTSGRVAFVIANDASARSVQILGEGQADRLAYWSAAKSMPGCKPTSPRAWLPERFELDRWPALRLETRVNGEIRQDAGLEQLLETPRQMLGRIVEAVGPLPANTLILTGTPAGIALTVSRWKRAMGEHLLDRVGRLRAALGSYSSAAEFLRPGDHVEVRAGFLGSISHVITIEPEP